MPPGRTQALLLPLGKWKRAPWCPVRCRQRCQGGSGQPCLWSNASVQRTGPGTASPGSLLATAPQEHQRCQRGCSDVVTAHPSSLGTRRGRDYPHVPDRAMLLPGAPQLPCCSWVQHAAGHGAQARNLPRRFPRRFSGASHCPEPPAWGAQSPSKSARRGQQVDGEKRCRRQRHTLPRGCHPCLSLLPKGRKPNWGQCHDPCPCPHPSSSPPTEQGWGRPAHPGDPVTPCSPAGTPWHQAPTGVRWGSSTAALAV